MRSVDFADDCAEFLSGRSSRSRIRHRCGTRSAPIQKKPCARHGVFDSLGEHQTDDDRLAILRSQEFALTANRVRMAMIKIGQSK